MTGLVAVDPEAIGRDPARKGRLVLKGICFDFDSATLQDPSAEALAAAATYLAAHPGELPGRRSHQFPREPRL